MEKADFNKQLGVFVRKKRLEKGWSQPDLAAKLKNNFQNISRLERGETAPTLYWCSQLADAFEMSLSDFVSEFEENKS